MQRNWWVFLLGLLLVLPSTVEGQGPMPPKREFRGAWICTLANLDWPSRANMHSDLQKNEFSKILNNLESAGMNAVFVQVRPAGDAFYPSEMAPWSQYISGRQGVPPSPFYDPLEFMIDECHERNMEFHAWFNPFRALSHIQFSSVAAANPINHRPDWFFNYGISKYFDPGVPEARHYLVRVIMEVVRNYDIDGIHLDDYFYPYPIAGQPIPDSRSFRLYGNGFTDIKAWRRHNVDAFVEELADSIFLNNPTVKFGISPFGVWRNDDEDLRGSGTVRALSAYDELYADTRKWLKYGWVDYMVPQLYWKIGSDRAAFDVLLEWWDKQSSDRHVYIGHAIYLLQSETKPSWAKVSEFVNQVELCRTQNQICGSAWFRCSTIMDNAGGISNSMRYEMYNHPALVPSMPWIDSIPPNRPIDLKIYPQTDGIYLAWEAPEPAEDLDLPAYYVVYRFGEGQANDLNDPRNILSLSRE
ncbi:MAG TPA: family 10 glycosylhydrolase, partial [Bacteroidia bacterium]|nr:family 10 glycosylhydrolase [Bacteroidia bacterium]